MFWLGLLFSRGSWAAQLFRVAHFVIQFVFVMFDIFLPLLVQRLSVVFLLVLRVSLGCFFAVFWGPCGFHFCVACTVIFSNILLAFSSC